MSFQLNDKIEVFWVDAFNNPDWLKPEKAQTRPSDDIECLSVGYYLHEDDKLLYMSWSRGVKVESERSQHIIPKGCIISIKRLVYEEENAIRTENGQAPDA